MLDITSFVVVDNMLVYHGANRYHIFDRGNYYRVIVEIMDKDQETVINEERFSCSSLSSAIAQIEEMEA